MHVRLRMILINITWYIRFKITIVLFAFTLILNIFKSSSRETWRVILVSVS